MWCRFLTFCVLVSLILFVVASCIYGRPSFHLFFHRCCGDDIENDQVIFESFGNNFLKERLVGGDIIEADSDTVLENEDIGRIDEAKQPSINDPEVKKWIADTQISDSDEADTIEDLRGVEFNSEIKKKDSKSKDEHESSEKRVNDVDLRRTLPVATDEEQTGKDSKDIAETTNDSKYLNVHDSKHKIMIRNI